MDPVTLIREQIKVANDWLEGTMAGVNDEVAHWQPGGSAPPIGSRYAHLVVSEDILVNNLIKGSPPLFATSWAGKTGLVEPQAAFNTTLEWAQGVKIDLEAVRQYAQVVYANTDETVASLREEDLERTIDLTDSNFGKWSLSAFLITFVLGHVRDIMGEISALKGVKGMQGYPFFGTASHAKPIWRSVCYKKSIQNQGVFNKLIAVRMAGNRSCSVEDDGGAKGIDFWPLRRASSLEASLSRAGRASR